MHKIHGFTANDYAMFQEIWNEFRGVINTQRFFDES